MHGDYSMLHPYDAQRREFERLDAEGRMKNPAEAWFLQNWINELEREIAMLQWEHDGIEDKWLSERAKLVDKWEKLDPLMAEIEKKRIEHEADETRDLLYGRKRECRDDIQRLSALVAACQMRLQVIEMMLIPDI